MQLNYFRVCYITTDIIADGLRSIFKQEWDNRYKVTMGEWKDEPGNGLDFWNGETPRNQRRNACLLATMVNGNRAEWDCTMLFYAILYSDCIHGLNPVVQSNVDDLRKFRNEEFAHITQGHLTDAEFQNGIGKVDVAFQALGLSTVKIQAIRTQTSFPTEELKYVLKKVDDLKQENQVLEVQLNKDVFSFCILPPKPSHDVASRDCEVAYITEQLKELKETNENSLSYLYISGNPGSGKSQLAMAGLVAKRFFDREVQEIPSGTSFVMTINAESPKTLLESYASFARHLKCPEYAITNTRNSNDLNTEKIANLKTLISTKIEHYASWLLVVDNVTSISDVRCSFAGAWNEQRFAACRRRLVCSLLSMLSGIADSEMEQEVAQALDYQPLDLASAATYVKLIQQTKVTSNFSWNDYLKNLEKGQRDATETILAETNPSYQKSMTKAITLAVEEVMTSDKVIDHTFTLLSLCAPQPLSLEIVINYIFNIYKEIDDEEAISMRIQRCSLLLFEEAKSGVYIRVHQVVHHAINTVIKDRPQIEHIQAVNGAIRSLSQLITDDLLTMYWDNEDSLVNKQHIVCHLKTLVIKIEDLFSAEQGLTQAAQTGISNKWYAKNFENLGQICKDDSEFYVAKKFYNLALQTIRLSDANRNSDVVRLCVKIGKANTCLGDLHQAKDNYEYALSILLKKSDPGHIKGASSIYIGLGIVHNGLGDLEQAKVYHHRALAICLKKVGREPGGAEHVDVARAYNDLGKVHRKLGDLEQAKENFNRALAIRVKKFGREHVDVASTHTGLGIVQRRLGHLAFSVLYQGPCEYALAIRVKKYSPEHVDVATTHSNLGHVHSELGDLKQAKENFDRALAILVKKYGPGHVDVATTHSDLGIVHRGLGDLEQAKEHFDHALAIRVQKYGPEHVDVATTRSCLGLVHSDLGDLEQAKENFDHALAIRVKTLGPEHVYVASIHSNLGHVHRELGDLEQAKENFNRALAIRFKEYGPEHIDLANTHSNLGLVHRDLADPEQAKNNFDRALAILVKKYGPEHVDVASTHSNLGHVHRKLGDLEQAKECYDRALAIF
ncbi:hypothetical protein ACROYT_G030349 [Oculina patagonica]